MNTPRFVPVQSRPAGRGKLILSGLGLVIATAGFLTLPRYFDRASHAKWKADMHERADMLTRWKGWLEAASCLRRDDSARWFPSGATASDTPDMVATTPYVDPKCVQALTPLVDDPALTTTAKAAVRDWLAADRAIGEGDPPALARTKLAARDQVREHVRKDLLPVVREHIRKVQHGHDAQRDYVWWHLELGFQLEDILDRGRDAHSQGHDVAAAVDPQVRTLIDKMRSADSAVGVREMSSLRVLERATGDAAWPALKAVEDNGAWDGLEDDNSVFGLMPPEPQGCNIELPK